MPVPKVSSESSFLENVPDSNLYVLRQEFQMEMEKVMAKLKSLEDQLLREVLEKEFAGHKADPDAKDVAQDTATNAPTEPNLPEEVEVIEVEQHEDKEHHVGMVHFSLSAWTYPVVLGLADAGPWDVVFSVLLMFLNFGMQVMFSYIILGVDFMGEEFEEQVAFAKRWRSSFAHDWKYVDLTSRSLVTRVCGGDGSLMLANRQATLVEHINSYMGLKHDEFEAGFFQTGILLCTLCILLWALCVYKEFRNVWLTLEGIWQLPRTPETVLRDNVLQSLSKLRFKWLASTCITRFVIATVLLISGTQWLARTTSITELMLNAVALNAILDVDEFLFAGFTPLSIQVAIEKLEPMTIRHSRRRSQSESLVLFLLLLFTALFPYLALLQPLGQTMLAVKWNLCAGNQQFVVAKNTNSQVIVGFETGSALSEAANTVLQLAVERQVHQSPDDRYGYYISFQPPSIFERARSRSMAQESDQFSFCIETDHLDPGGSLYGDPILWYNVAAPRLRTAAALLGREDVDSCEQAADLCNRTDAQLLRMVCGRTCNCTDPHHFPWLKVPAQGCQTSCLNEAVREFKWEQCQDQPADGTWSELWDGYVPTLNHWLGTDISQSTTFYNDILQWLAGVKALGCPALGDPKFKFEVTGQREWCAGDPNFFRPLALNCPVSCGCLAENPPSYCPPCSANSSA